MRFPPCAPLVALCFLAACSVELAGSMSGETLDYPDGGGLDSAIAFGDGGGSTGGDSALPDTCSGQTQQSRLRFEQAQVVAPAVCKSETQKRTCSGGSYGAWSGTFEAETCELAPYNSCGSVMHGGQEKRTRYVMAVASSSDACKSEEQTRTCSDGNFDEWTGTYQAESCVVGFLGGCDLFGGSFSCEPGTSCMYKGGLSLSSACLGTIGHVCAANSECAPPLTSPQAGGTCVAGKCANKSAPGGVCDEQADCAGCGSGATVSCAQNVCRCSETASCTSNDQCLGTCVASKCVAANTTCDSGDQADCRAPSMCMRPTKSNTFGCYLADGQACSSNDKCEHVCRGAVCAVAGMTGAVCDENADCSTGLTCRSGQCAAPGTIGEQCDEPADCGAGLACGPYTAGAITTNVCLLAAGKACTLDTQCASGVCGSGGMGPGAACQ